MTEKEFFVKTLTSEAPIFDRVLRAVPTDNSDYKPDPKSPNALGLVGRIVGEFSMYEGFLTKPVFDLMEDKFEVTSPADGADKLKPIIEKIIKLADNMSEEDWQGAVKLSVGGQHEWNSTHGGTAWGWLLDAIHHRGQLSTYLRAMGGKVPSIYGPSADSPM